MFSALIYVSLILVPCLAYAASDAAASGPGAAAIRVAAVPAGMGVAAVSAAEFLDSLGVNTHVDQGYDPRSYIEPLRYTGIRQVRDGARNIAADIMIHQATGVRFAIIAGGDIKGVTNAAATLAAADALLAIEGPNEANNFPINYKGQKGGGPDGTWVPVADFQRDMYQALKSSPILRGYPVFGPSETGAETENVGLQFLTIPNQTETILPAGTRFADYANVHNYVCGTVNRLGDNQAWNAADPTLNGSWDGLYGNYGITWHKRFQGYTRPDLVTLPKVGTETGWDTQANEGGEYKQGAVLTNTYLAQFKRGWRYTFIYELRDDEGGAGKQGLYDGPNPKLSATYIHNLTSVLADRSAAVALGRLDYKIFDQPATVHDLLLQKSTGQFDLVVWDERAAGSDNFTISFSDPAAVIRVYDIVTGDKPLRTLNDVGSIQLSLTDHAVVLELDAQRTPAAAKRKDRASGDDPHLKD